MCWYVKLKECFDRWLRLEVLYVSNLSFKQKQTVLDIDIPSYPLGPMHGIKNSFHSVTLDYGIIEVIRSRTRCLISQFHSFGFARLLNQNHKRKSWLLMLRQFLLLDSLCKWKEYIVYTIFMRSFQILEFRNY